MKPSSFLRCQQFHILKPCGIKLQGPLDLELQSGDLFLVSGPNGCGKSTFLKTLVGAYHHFLGAMESQLRPQDINYLPQLQGLSFHLPLTLYDILELEFSGKALAKRVEDLGLLPSNQWKLFWNKASGGERKRTLLTRCLLRDFRLLLLDEPFNHLDPEAQVKVAEQIRLRASVTNAPAIVVVSHRCPGQEVLSEGAQLLTWNSGLC